MKAKSPNLVHRFIAQTQKVVRKISYCGFGPRSSGARGPSRYRLCVLPEKLDDELLDYLLRLSGVRERNLRDLANESKR